MKIGILTSGGDAPGMNSAIHSCITLAKLKNIEMICFLKGLEGVYKNNYIDSKDLVVNSSLGGTILKSSRFGDFIKPEIQEKCINNLKSLKISNLIIIGGNGSLEAAKILSKDFNTVVIPATIDNDIKETISIGFDTAINNAMKSIDNIKDSAISHDRIFFIEVMGNKSGKIAYNLMLSNVGIAIQNEINTDIDLLAKKIVEQNILIVSENIENRSILENLEKKLKKNVIHIKLGHIQRGGNPTYIDRALGTIYGIKAFENISKSINGLVSIKDYEDIQRIDNKIYNILLGAV
jgi:6-phosphofructokinase 1